MCAARRLLLIGSAAVGVASVLAAFSTSPAMLITTRAVLGIAEATLVPSTLSLIRNMFHDEQQRATAMGVWGASFAVGAKIGPLWRACCSSTSGTAVYGSQAFVSGLHLSAAVRTPL